ncbi:hypothetical protein [Leptospira yasudae]|uniref:Uncharacterized protein n=1 Tax=Leptospira yasudae TaxID=2202201 RepID=A0A6N4QY33_9LEPT|nr:hypothetical protein [Leptospira yasudae]TGL76950.1 hypothetical protein EHQ72_12555 [Leptospira yasudae]TGL78298.1 hypothetical protein EHQ77_12120 [Leptospira yasudae]TGL80994.1 hypothetical protein EHQ83_15940 [Leptospira yasudae]
MTRYCRFNGFFEEELKSSSIAPPRLDLKNRSLENLFFLFQSITNSETTMLLSERPDPGWTAFWKTRGMEFCKFELLKRNPAQNLQINSTKLNLSSLDSARVWEEWGAVSDLSNTGEILFSVAKADVSKRLNSKLLLTHWKSEFEFQDLPARVLEKSSHLSSLIQEWSEFREDRIVLKPEFSFSGRHKILKFSSLATENDPDGRNSEKESAWFPCVAEPWVQRTQDFSCLYDFSAGVPTFSGSTIQICDETGKYSGAYLPSEKESEFYSSQIDPIVKPLAKTFASDYTGPVAIDGFEFYSQNIKKIRRLSEANFRWSMGRILLELSRSDLFQRSKKNSDFELCILPLPLQKPIENYSEWIFNWGNTQGLEILPLTPDRFFSGKSYGTSWVLLRFIKNSSGPIRERIQTFYSEWRKRILH